MKKIVSILLIGILTVGISTGCGCSKKEKKDEPIVNTNEDVIKDQEVETFKLTNTSLVYVDGMSTLVTEVKNDSTETAYIKSFNIIVKDANGNQMLTMLGYIGEEIPAGETRTITSSTDMDLSKAGAIEYTINK